MIWTVLWWFTCFLCIAILGAVSFVAYLRLRVATPQFPGPPQHWFAGNAPEFQGYIAKQKMHDCLVKWWEDYGKIVDVRLLFDRILLITDPPLMRAVARNMDAFGPAVSFCTAFSEVSNGLLVLGGDKWKAHRVLLKPAFYPAQLQTLPGVATAKVDELSKAWSEKPVDLERQFAALAMDTIGIIGFGYDTNAVKEPGNKISHAVETAAAAIERRIQLPKILWNYLLDDTVAYKDALKTVHGLMHDILQTRIKERATGAKPKTDILEFLLNERENPDTPEFTDQEVVDELIMFFLAGHETTSHGMSFASFCLWGPLGKDALKKAREEVDRVLGDKRPTYESLAKLEYLDACAKEALRLFPVVGLSGRTILKDTVIADKVVKAGATVFLHFRGVHRDPEVFTDPHSYIPERWLKSTTDPKLRAKAGSFFAFGDGPRTCIGQSFAFMELKSVLAYLLQNYDMDILTKDPDLRTTVTIGAREMMAVVRPRKH